MSFVLHEIMGVLLVGACALGVLALAEVLKRTTPLPTEMTRKFAHVGSGIAVLAIPLFIHSAVTVFILCAGFAALMVGTHYTGLLQGVHGVGRGVGGVLWYPITAFLMYLLTFNVLDAPYYMYAIPVLVLATADAMGAVVGKRWGSHRYEVMEDHHRSWEGSAAVFVTALAAIAIPLMIAGAFSGMQLVLISLATALVATMLETVSVYGLDNFLVPFGTLFTLNHLAPMSMGELAFQFTILAACATGVVVVSWKKCSTAGGTVSLLMAAYAIWTTGGDTWIMPLTGVILAFAIYERLSPVADLHTKSRYALGTAVSGLAVPVAICLVANTDAFHTNMKVMYTAYLAALACDAAVIFFMLPQNQTFVFKRLRRTVATRDLFQPAPTLGKFAFAMCGALIPLLCVPGGLPSTATTTIALTLALSGVAVFLGATVMIKSSHAMCPKCGGVNLRGLYCCQDTRLGEGDARVAVHSLSFRETYVLANSVAAVAAAAVVLWLQ